MAGLSHERDDLLIYILVQPLNQGDVFRMLSAPSEPAPTQNVNVCWQSNPSSVQFRLCCLSVTKLKKEILPSYHHQVQTAHKEEYEWNDRAYHEKTHCWLQLLHELALCTISWFQNRLSCGGSGSSSCATLCVRDSHNIPSKCLWNHL